MSNIRPDLSIDYSYIRVPYDAGVRTFKASKKTIEKDMSSILNSIIALKKEKQINKTQTRESLDSFISRLKGLKRKLDESYREEEEVYECCKKRLIQLDEVDLKNKASIGKYQNFRVQNLIVEYLVRNDYNETAKMVTEDCGIREFMSIDAKVIQEHNKILNELKNRTCETALQWSQTNKTKLMKTNSRLEVKLMFQEFIELIKKNQQDKAMLYLRKYSEAMKSQNIEEIRKAMGCLTFCKQLDKFPDYQYYFEEDRWEDLISMFKQESFHVSGVTTQSNLEITLQAGLSALKTESCMNHSMQKPDTCPVCNPHMRKLANKVPATQKMVSSLICRLSGEVMDEHNPPVALPNGQVYSEKALKKMAEKDNGKIVCPVSKTEYTLQDLKKIYIS